MSRSSSLKARPTKAKRAFAIVMVAVVVLVPFFGFFVGPVILKSYDARHRVHPVCKVVSAHSGADSSRSLKGVGSTIAHVVFETEDCGTLVLQWGVSRNNQERLASSVVSGDYHFDVGAGSFRVRSFLNTVGQAVYVKSFGHSA